MDTSEKVFGGCEGPDAMYVKLISSDGHEFIVKREHALTSGTIKAMLSGPGQFAENETNVVNFREIPSHVLQKVCMYFTYKVRDTIQESTLEQLQDFNTFYLNSGAYLIISTNHRTEYIHIIGNLVMSSDQINHLIQLNSVIPFSNLGSFL